MHYNASYEAISHRHITHPRRNDRRHSPCNEAAGNAAYQGVPACHVPACHRLRRSAHRSIGVCVFPNEQRGAGAFSRPVLRNARQSLLACTPFHPELRFLARATSVSSNAQRESRRVLDRRRLGLRLAARQSGAGRQSKPRIPRNSLEPASLGEKQPHDEVWGPPQTQCLRHLGAHDRAIAAGLSS